MNGKEVLGVDASLLILGIGQTIRYEPTLSVVYQNSLFLDIRGHVDYIQGVKYNADFSVKGLTHRPIDISGDLSFSSNRTTLSLYMNSDQFGYIKLHGTLKPALHGSFLAKALVNYELGKSTQVQQAHFLLKFDQYEKASLYKSNTHLKLESTQYDSFNIDLRHALQLTDYLFDSTTDLILFGNEWQSKQIYRNFERKDAKGGGGEDIRIEEDKTGSLGGKGSKEGKEDLLRRSFEVLGSLKCDKKNLHYKLQALHESTSSNSTSLVLAQLNDRQQLLLSYSLANNDHDGQTLSARAIQPWFAIGVTGEYLVYDENTVDANVQLEWSRINSSQYQLQGHLNYLFDPTSAQSKLSATVILGNQLDPNSASLVTDNLHYTLDAKWNTNSINFTLHLPNNRLISGDLVYTSTASDTRSGGTSHKELSLSLRLTPHDAVSFSLLYSRDGQTRRELIATKLAWKRGNEDWKRIEFNVGYKLFESVNMELLLPDYYFHGTLDVIYLGLYSPNSLRSELSWGSTREIVSLIQIESKFQLQWIHSYCNLTVLTPFNGWEQLTLDSIFRLSNGTNRPGLGTDGGGVVEMDLQATGHLPSHSAYLSSHIQYNPVSNQYVATLYTNNTLFSIESVELKLDNAANYSRFHFSAEPGNFERPLVRLDYSLAHSVHSGNIEFFTPFSGLDFVALDLNFNSGLTLFNGTVTPFLVKHDRLASMGDYTFSYALQESTYSN
uniref:Uncharacterized protein n=1 Tax=Cacopsylla melanoneura TaxID=428564 RepID=A0A8D8W8S5_9HEMI